MYRTILPMLRPFRQIDQHHASRRAAAACRDRVRSQQSPTPDALRRSPSSLRPGSFVLHTFLLVSLIVSGWPPVVQAGDILRGGATTTGGGRKNAEARQSAGADAAALAKTKAADRLARTTKAVTDMRNLQEAARNAAGAGGVPDGLTPGGLKVATGANAKWTGALAPVQSGSNVNITQTQSQALLHWETFNVGKNTTVNFDQKAGGVDARKWVAFNKVVASATPSQILGSINADGHVYIINPNGIIFGAGSQVNARALVASALPINPFFVEKGLLANENKNPQFVFDADLETAPAGGYGTVTVQAGAMLSSPRTEDKTGGRVALIGSSVTNEGMISTPDGQTVLAAGLQVGWEASTDTTLRGLDVYVGRVSAGGGEAINRGLIEAPRGDVYLTGKNVRQLGVVESSTSVAVNGRVDLKASYGATPNPLYESGAADKPPFLYANTGFVELGTSSVTRILPEWDSTEKIAKSGVDLLRSTVEIEGRLVYFAKDSSLLAPSGNVAVRAGVWEPQISRLEDRFVFTKGQIYLDQGSLVDVSGSTEVLVPIDQNILSVELRGNELANSPLQRGGKLRGTPLTVDVRNKGTYNGNEWTGTPLGDASGFEGLIERSIGELTVSGGSIALQAGESVVVRNGATLDVSGGYINYQTATYETSRVLYKGRLIDIKDANPDLEYDGIGLRLTDFKNEEHTGWADPYFDSIGGTESDLNARLGASDYGDIRNYYTGYNVNVRTHKGSIREVEIFQNPLAPPSATKVTEQSYYHGGDAGSVAISAPGMAIDGALLGQVVEGKKQIRNGVNVEDGSSLPESASLTLRFEAQDPVSYTGLESIRVFYSPTPPVVEIASGTQSPAAEFSATADLEVPALSSERTAKVMLDPELLEEQGFSNLTVENSEGLFLVPQTTDIELRPGGSLVVEAANVSVKGRIRIPGGQVSLTAYNFSPYLSRVWLADKAKYALPLADPLRGTVAFGPAAVVDVSGLMVDDRPTSSTAWTLPLQLDGGNVNVEAYNIDLAAGSLIDVSGGVHLSSTTIKKRLGVVTDVRAQSTVTYGDVGSISLLAGRDPGINSIFGGLLMLRGNLRGFTGMDSTEHDSDTGTLTLQAQRVVIGSEQFSDGLTLSLPAEFFRAYGFTHYELRGLGLESLDISPSGLDPLVHPELTGVEVLPNAVIEPVANSFLARPYSENGQAVLSTHLLPLGENRNPVSLTLKSSLTVDAFSGDMLLRGDVIIGTGSRITTDPKGSVAVEGTTVSVLGSIFAPGGSIKISGSSSSTVAGGTSQDSALLSVFIGPRSVLSTAGLLLRTPDAFGRIRGEVLDGGTISIKGNILASQGALIDVSGAAAVLDYTLAEAGLDNSPSVAKNSGVNARLERQRTVPTTEESDGGVIALEGLEFLFSDATLLGRPGGPSAAGGALVVSSGKFYSSTATSRKSTDINLQVTQGNMVTEGLVAQVGGRLARAGVEVALGEQLGHFSADRFAQGGFDHLVLKGNIGFVGPVAISAPGSIRIASKGVISADSATSLSAPYVALGKISDEKVQNLFTDELTGLPLAAIPTFGSGRLSISSSFIDVGVLVLNGIGTADFSADGGDIRFVGVPVEDAKTDITQYTGGLSMVGDLKLKAAQVYPATAHSIGVYVYDPPGGSGSVTISGSGEASLPLSAGGNLEFYARTITQAGVVRAPIGSIALGYDGTGTAPIDPISKQAAPISVSTVLAAGSETSVSAVGLNGAALILPYGTSSDGTNWTSPSGINITAGGVPEKSVTVSGLTVTTEAGSVVDLTGGGDLMAYRWITGTGGTSDILASEDSYAVIPGFSSKFAPYSPGYLNTNLGNANELFSDSLLSNNQLGVGSRVYLDEGSGLPAGDYTLLPARYALLDGAYLVTKKSSKSPGAIQRPDGTWRVSGFAYNGLNSGRKVTGKREQFEVLNSEQIHTRAEYVLYSANEFLRDSAKRLDQTVPMLPADAGAVAFQAVGVLDLRGAVRGKPATGGVGARVDISTTGDILIAGPGSRSTSSLTVLDTSILNSWGAESLLIGGIRQATADGVSLATKAQNITVNNAGTALAAPEVILAAKQTLELLPGASILQEGVRRASSGMWTAGNPSVAASGNGVLLWISSDESADIFRSGTSTAAGPNLIVHSGVTLRGNRLILDSTSGTSLSAGASLSADVLSLNSGRISVQLNSPGALLPTNGLVLGQDILNSIASTRDLSFLSYTTFDIYGTGRIGSSSLSRLALRSGEIRGFNNAGGTVTVSASTIQLDNLTGNSGPGPVAPLSGTLAFEATKILLGVNQVNVDQYALLRLDATGGIALSGEGSDTRGLRSQGSIRVSTPILAAAAGTTFAMIADSGFLDIVNSGTAPGAGIVSGLGAKISLKGPALTVSSDISLPSGILDLRATAGDLVIGGHLDVAGTSKEFYDVVRFTDGGTIRLSADTGNVRILSGASLDVGAQAGAGDAGKIAISAPVGNFVLGGSFNGTPGVGGLGGSFSLDTNALLSTQALFASLNAGAFSGSRELRMRTGDVRVEGGSQSSELVISADGGKIEVIGTGPNAASLFAGGATGGRVALVSRGDLIVRNGATISVRAQDYQSSGKGGSILLEAGTQVNGVQGTGTLTLEAGALLDLTVVDAAQLGELSGTLHLRAPRTGVTAAGVGAGNGISISSLGSTIVGASSIVVEGYKVYSNATADISGVAGTITTALQNKILAEGQTFLGVSGTASATYTAIKNSLLASQPGLESALVILPGAEIVNTGGDLTLGTSSSANTSDWNLGTYRFGPKAAPGVLTLRASRDVIFFNTLSDGFTAVVPSLLNSYPNINGNSSMWLAPLMGMVNNLPADPTKNLPINAQSWSYRITGGASLGAANSAAVGSSGSVLIGKDKRVNDQRISGGSLAETDDAVRNGLYQVVRTGTGSITINAATDVQLRNPLASIYTAGVALPTASAVIGGAAVRLMTISSLNDFIVPVLSPNLTGLIVQSPLSAFGSDALGVSQQVYQAFYSLAGGDVSISAGNDIRRVTRTSAGALIDDSSRQMPGSWLYRRGYLDSTGDSGVSGVLQSNVNASITDPEASTTWWVDFSNFFLSVGALGGGDVTLRAGNDVMNVDAVIPTNARMAMGNPTTAAFVELGGGDLFVSAGRDVNGGVYYVERGTGTITAGRSVTTNDTRSPSLGILSTTKSVQDSSTWLGTTLFVGKSSFDVSARGNVLLGPVSNPFLLPSGINNGYWYKSYFTTYSPTAAVSATSLSGDVTIRQAVSVNTSSASAPALQEWYRTQNQLSSTSAAFLQPWLRLSESAVAPFSWSLRLMAPNLTAASYSGSVKLLGDIVLFPSASGGLEVLAANRIEGFGQTGVFGGSAGPNGITGGVASYRSAWINVSDADPSLFPRVTSPFAYQSHRGGSRVKSALISTDTDFLLSKIDLRLKESGETSGTEAFLQKKLARHASSGLHANDVTPVRLYSGLGNIESLTLFTPKLTQIYSGKDLTDVALYIQNASEDSISMISASRDIIPYNENSPLRSVATKAGYRITDPSFAFTADDDTNSLAGDIQISGPGLLEVLAGRDLDLGSAPAFGTTGRGAGLISVGNARNPALPFGGAEIIAGSGIGFSAGLAGGVLDYASFLDEVEKEDSLQGYLESLLQEFGVTDVDALDAESQARVALSLFYRVLRNTGRLNKETGSYETGFAAIESLFGPTSGKTGEIKTQQRSIRTATGGAVSLFAPNGGLRLQEALTDGQESLTPPGIVTEYGGGISIFTDTDVDIGVSRIFTLRGGDVVIWASTGDIAAGKSSKTLQTAPPTRVLIDPASADVETDLSGLATGGGIGVLATVEGIEPGDVDLIAVEGIVDAGDAGIRSSGNLNISATAVLNAGNIQAGGTSTGVPSSVTPTSAPAPVAPAPTSSTAAVNAASQEALQQATQKQEIEEPPSTITVEVLGYGGGEDDQNQG